MSLLKIKEYKGVDAVIVASNIILVIFGCMNFFEGMRTQTKVTKKLNDISNKLDMLLLKK